MIEHLEFRKLQPQQYLQIDSCRINREEPRTDLKLAFVSTKMERDKKFGLELHKVKSLPPNLPTEDWCSLPACYLRICLMFNMMILLRKI